MRLCIIYSILVGISLHPVNLLQHLPNSEIAANVGIVGIAESNIGYPLLIPLSEGASVVVAGLLRVNRWMRSGEQ